MMKIGRERPSGRRAGAGIGRASRGADDGTGAGMGTGSGEVRERGARWRARAASAGERMAEEFLRLRGFEILDRNVRSGRGEIDLIAREADTVVFVEVKLRTGPDSSAPLVAVNWKKREDVERAATRWLQSRRITDLPVRFDVVGITWDADGSRLRVEHIRNAFPGGGRHFF
jgi:putative endonuclease